MNSNYKIAMLILSCDKFSDLWDGQVKLLEKNWPSRNMKTFIVTDKQHMSNYSNVSIMAAGEGKEWSERLSYALSKISTDYVFITLDDYYLIKPVNNDKINKILDIMDKDNYDYVRLYLRPKCPKKNRIKEYENFYKINTRDRYSVNLYAGIWKKSFLQNTIKSPKNAWQFEVSLPHIATEIGAKCAMSNNKEYVILDVVRKGKLLHKAVRYFKKNKNIYNGNRKVISWWYEIKLGIRTLGIRIMPKFVTKLIRNYMIKRGHHYYSQEQ